MKAEDIRYYWPDLWNAIELAAKTPEKKYTHYFRIGGNSRMHDPIHCRKILRTLQNLGHLIHFDEGFNTHMWQITTKGIVFYEKYKNDKFNINFLYKS